MAGWRDFRGMERRTFSREEATRLIPEIEGIFLRAHEELSRAEVDADRARHDVTRAEADLKRADLAMARARSELDRAIRRLEGEGSGRAEVRVAVAQTEAELAQAEANLGQARADLIQAEAKLAAIGALESRAAAELKVRLLGLGCLLREVGEGEVDFLARRGREEIYLCWKLGEERVEHWHRVDEGLGERRPLGELT